MSRKNYYQMNKSLQEYHKKISASQCISRSIDGGLQVSYLFLLATNFDDDLR